MHDAFRRPSLIDALEERIREDIISGRYPAGHLLPPERELAQKYGVTRTSLKHSLVRLEAAGLIQTRHGVGSTVLSLEGGGAELLPALIGLSGPEETSDQKPGGVLGQVLEARRLIGAITARMAATNASNDDIGELRGLVEEVSSSGLPVGTNEVAARLLVALASSSGNLVFRLIANTLNDAYVPLNDGLSLVTSDCERLAADLDAVVGAITGSNPGRSEREADRFFELSGRHILDTYRSQRSAANRS